MWETRKIKIMIGTKIQSDPTLYYNKLDILITLTNPDMIHELKFSVSYLQNVRLQEKIKTERRPKTQFSKSTNRMLIKLGETTI